MIRPSGKHNCRPFQAQLTSKTIFLDTLKAMETKSRSYEDLISKMGLFKFSKCILF